MSISEQEPGAVQRIVDYAVGIAKESAKAVARETLHSTGSFLNTASAQLLQCLPGGSSTLVPGRHLGWDTGSTSRPSFRAPQLPTWMQESASSLNKFLLEAAEHVEADFDDTASIPDADADAAFSHGSLPGDRPASSSLHEADGASEVSSPRGEDGSAFLQESPGNARALSRRSGSSSSMGSVASSSQSGGGPLGMLQWLLIVLLWPFLVCWRFLSGSHQPRRRRRGRAGGGAARRMHDPGTSTAGGARSGRASQHRLRERRLVPRTISSSSSTSITQQLLRTDLGRTISGAMDYFHNTQHLNDFQRRGLLEELQVLLELLIERFFDGVQSLIMFCCAPWRLFTAGHGRRGRDSAGTSVAPFGGAPPALAPTGSGSGDSEGLVDARTCEDIVKEAGYPFERLRVITEDGYILFMERIPRKDSQKALYLQHGVFDSSLGWLSNGVVGSQAFAAHDQGYDVFLGNMRGYAAGGHVDGTIGPQRYWAYSVNELGMCDVKAMIDTIYETKAKELRAIQRSGSSRQRLAASAAQLASDGPAESQTPFCEAESSLRATGQAAMHDIAWLPSDSVSQDTEGQSRPTTPASPFEIQAVAHSLGGAALMTYIVTQRMKGKPHHLSHVILLSPAGFHIKTPILFNILGFLKPFLDLFMPRWMPGFFIPTRGLRLLFNKLAQDFHNFPALGALMQVIFSNMIVGGDPSDWVGALRVPHYTMYDMPGVAYRVMKHLAQMKLTKKFQLYDFGSPAANIAAYGVPEPPDLGAHYHLVDIPVDVVSGRQDKLIPPEMVRYHYESLRAGGCETTLQQFEYAHLDFTLAHKQELLSYVSARLMVHSHWDKGLSHSKSCPRLPMLGRRRSQRRSIEGDARSRNDVQDGEESNR